MALVLFVLLTASTAEAQNSFSANNEYEVWVRDPEPVTKWFVAIEFADGTHAESHGYDSEFYAMAAVFGWWEYSDFLQAGDKTEIFTREVPAPWEYADTFNNYFEAAQLAELFRRLELETAIRVQRFSVRTPLSDLLQPWVRPQSQFGR